MADRINVEVVWANPESQVIVELRMVAGSTIADAIAQSQLGDRFPDASLDAMPVGIWGQVAQRDARLRDGDRVEIYRPLELDPREARRQRV